TKETGQGTGLGLSQVYGFVKQSGGHIKIYSEVGQGTTIRMYLPRHHLPDQPQPELHLDAVEKGKGERILVVEDDEDVRSYIAEVLQDLGYRVLTAPDAAVALHMLERPEQPVDLLLTDVVLPGTNGRQLADTVAPRHPGMRVLFMTGYSRNAIV